MFRTKTGEKMGLQTQVKLENGGGKHGLDSVDGVILCTALLLQSIMVVSFEGETQTEWK